MSKTITDLRDVLFDTLQGARDGTIDIERVRAINDVAQTLVNTAKAEIDYMKVTGGTDSGFIAGADRRTPPRREPATARPASAGSDGRKTERPAHRATNPQAFLGEDGRAREVS